MGFCEIQQVLCYCFARPSVSTSGKHTRSHNWLSLLLQVRLQRTHSGFSALAQAQGKSQVIASSLALGSEPPSPAFCLVPPFYVIEPIWFSSWLDPGYKPPPLYQGVLPQIHKLHHLLRHSVHQLCQATALNSGVLTHNIVRLWDLEIKLPYTQLGRTCEHE